MEQYLEKALEVTGPWTGDWCGHEATLKWMEPIGDEIPGYWVVDVGDHGKFPVVDCIANPLNAEHLRVWLEERDEYVTPKPNGEYAVWTVSWSALPAFDAAGVAQITGATYIECLCLAVSAVEGEK